MARLGCTCGNTLSTTSIPNEVELHVYTGKEWDYIINVGTIDSIKIPSPKFEVWRSRKRVNLLHLFVLAQQE